jgi:hypothetical protein
MELCYAESGMFFLEKCDSCLESKGEIVDLEVVDINWRE